MVSRRFDLLLLMSEEDKGIRSRTKGEDGARRHEVGAARGRGWWGERAHVQETKGNAAVGMKAFPL